jgi:hypothetical protein
MQVRSYTWVVSSPTEAPTDLLVARGHGDRAAFDRLRSLVSQELRRLAGQYLRRERQGHTLQPTALVHEAYLRLIELERMQWQDRAHFSRRGDGRLLLLGVTVAHQRRCRLGPGCPV